MDYECCGADNVSAGTEEETPTGSNPHHNGSTSKSPRRPKNKQFSQATDSNVSAAASARGGGEERSHKNRQRRSRNKEGVITGKHNFRHPKDFMSVSVRSVPVEQRSAFEYNPPITTSEWHRANAAGRKAHKRLSPSLQHLELLHEMQSMKVVRQLDFSPSTGDSSDRLYLENVGDECDDDKQQLPQSSRSRRRRYLRDGRYRSIDPVKATVAALPSVPPVLCNKKVRLPCRSDVGFPNAGSEEIQAKQLEIKHETEWEEASPRLVVLVTSDDLGTAVHEDDDGSTNSSSIDCSSEQLNEEHLIWNGGGLQGLPWAGRELQQTKNKNAHHFGGDATGNTNKKRNCSSDDISSQFLQPAEYSMLAPPLDASFSASQGWRPRPFHDRPAGMAYCLCCPLSLELDSVIDAEPLVCSLALYTLPDIKVYSTNHKSSRRKIAYGKMSENFWFPAGNWKGKVKSSDVTMEDGAVDAELLASWLGRKHKAIFSYDPLTLPPGQLQSLFVVLEVYKIAHESSILAHNVDDGFVALNRTASVGGGATHLGAQLLMPLCFGVTNFFPPEGITNKIQWPLGDNKEMQLWSFPTTPDTREAFIERLAYIAAGVNRTTKTAPDELSFTKTSSSVGHGNHSFDSEEQQPVPPVATSSETETAMSNTKGVVGRLFRSSMKSTNKPHSHCSSTQSSSSSSYFPVDPPITEPMNGQAKLFLSSLSVDFLQVMLMNPTELGSKRVSNQSEKQLAKLLVDVSGDFAVCLDPKQHVARSEVAHQQPAAKKRSNLLRLPPPSEPAGYASASEFREVLYLPARLDKQYDVDSPLSYRSLLNLLYLYPRLLRLSGKTPGFVDLSKFTIRIRLLRSENGLDEDSEKNDIRGLPLRCFHNASPWTGTNLLDCVYTKLPGHIGDKHEKVKGLQKGIPMKDEFKLRLPPILDGSFSLHFTLFSVNDSDVEGIPLRAAGEASIPLSCSSRDAGSGVRVATIIPNGIHRLKLGAFQLQLETRVVSAIHVGDTAVATALRDYPYSKSHINLRDAESLLSPTSSTVSSVLDFRESFPSLLSNASESTIVAHFDVLLHLHLCNMIRLLGDKQLDTRDETKFIMGNMLSLFEVFRKLKLELLSTPVTTIGKMRVNMFLKKTLDMVDEEFLSPASVARNSTPKPVSEVEHTIPNDFQEDNHDFDQDLEQIDDSAIRFRGRAPHQKKQGSGASLVAAALGAPGIPFSRVAYGATKTDRMRVEAELHNNGPNFTHFFDDDETIATAPSLQSVFTSVWQANARMNKNMYVIQEEASESRKSTIRLPPTKQAKETGKNEEQHPTFRNNEFAKRVRTAARVMLAPCVGQSLPNILATGKFSSPRNSNVGNSSDTRFDKPEIKQASKGGLCLCSASSYVLKDGLNDLNSAGMPDGPVLLFSVDSFDAKAGEIACGDYLYESIMVLWLRSWFDRVQNTSGGHLNKAIFPIPEYDPSITPEDNIFSFYAHMDFLLPLCLKSIVLRYSVEVLPTYPPSTRAMLDESHMMVLEPFIEMLTRGLMGQAVAGLGSPSNRDRALLRALSSSELILEFLVGLLTVIHHEHMRILISKYFTTLRNSEREYLGEGFEETDFEWTEERLQYFRCSRQLRIRAIETFAVLPSFLALNYPLRYSRRKVPTSSEKISWMQQHKEMPEDLTLLRVKKNDGIESPGTGWLAEIILNEGLYICSSSCEAVALEAKAHRDMSQKDLTQKTFPNVPSIIKRPGVSLKRGDVLMFQSIAIHAITCIYELMLRRHAIDRRLQNNCCRESIAALFAGPIINSSIASVRLLGGMETTYKVRSLWLLSFIYILQEAPENVIRDHIRSFCNHKDLRIHRFIRLLRLCSSTFQNFVDLPRHSLFPSEIGTGLSPWLLQESFNTICAATITTVEECTELLSGYPRAQKKMMQAILDLLLHLLTSPQSPVTHLRTIGGALQALEQFGISPFLEIIGTNLQHWVRVILSLMNSVSLSVRSIAVDFVVSLLGGVFDLFGNIDTITLIFVTVLPEVAAREIAIYSAGGLVYTMEDVAKSLWPLRRSIADLEDANPLDDDRVDPQLSPILSIFCRSCQAIIDGVIVEMRLQGKDRIVVVGAQVELPPSDQFTFDADEESLFEAANSFVPETAPIQRIRWLLTLKRLHEAKQQWVEAAETLYLCAQTISDSIPHLHRVWRPSRFDLWSDIRRSLWRDTVGEKKGFPDRGNSRVVKFAHDFLEPTDILGTAWKPSVTGKLQQPTVPIMCTMLTNVAKEAIELYSREQGVNELAYDRFESLIKVILTILEDHGTEYSIGREKLLSFSTPIVSRDHFENEASLRSVLANISGYMTSLAQGMRLGVEDGSLDRKEHAVERPCYVAMSISGHKPNRFQESTTIPTFLEWDTLCICRVPKSIVEKESRDQFDFSTKLSVRFAKTFVTALKEECGANSVALRLEPSNAPKVNPGDIDGVTYLDVFPVEVTSFDGACTKLLSKRFFYTNGGSKPAQPKNVVEMTVAHPFPCALSRQRSLLTAETTFISNS